jgi:acetylornithine deacetylase/succinyl-diaminopimelate desuccinylase-like protein
VDRKSNIQEEEEEVDRAPRTADVAIISDMTIPAPNQPAITESMRGSLNLELEVRSARRDLHSELYGGAIHNPLQALSEIIASLHDDSGRVAIPGFYDRVRNLSQEKRAYMIAHGPSDADILCHARAAHGYGEPGYTLYERTTIRPALTINDIAGGYCGIGPKAVIPDHATGKLDFRLVPDQNPELRDSPNGAVRRFSFELCNRQSGGSAHSGQQT